jgi:hypothetical protein
MFKWVKYIRQLISHEEGSDEHVSYTTPTTKETFILQYKNLQVGVLYTENGQWHFKYADAFKNSNLSPIVGFPRIDVEYTSQELWPYFAYRIPSIKQPAIRDIVLLEKLDPKNESEMLKRFGRHTITTPFELIPLSNQPL